MTGQTILEAASDPHLFGPWFKDRWFKQKGSWDNWFSFLAAVFGLPMTETQLLTFQECTGLTEPPDGGAQEAYLIVGRRGGKSLILSLIASYLATMVDWSPYLNRGERGVVMISAADREQAGVIFGYIKEFISGVKVLRSLVVRETQDTLDLSNRVSITVATASHKTIRGRTLIAYLADEIAFWPTEGVDQDKEVLAAVRPSMATIPNAMLLVASSPYARKGELFDTYERYYGKPGDVLVWKAPTKKMNPAISDRVINQAYERDPASAAAEYGAEFRTDIENFIGLEVINACTVPGRFELPPEVVHNAVGFLDISGGVSDSHTCAVAFKNANNQAVLAAILERKGGDTESVVQEFTALFRRYGVSSVWSDRYGAAWVRDAFARYEIELRYSPMTRSDLYLELLPALRSRQVELLDIPKLRSQLLSLERRTSRTGKDSVDHPPRAGAHDDVSNSAAGALVMVANADRNRVLWWTGSDYFNNILRGIRERGEAPKTEDEYLADFDDEMKRRAFVRAGNLDHAGRPIEPTSNTPIVPEPPRRIGEHCGWLR